MPPRRVEHLRVGEPARPACRRVGADPAQRLDGAGAGDLVLGEGRLVEQADRLAHQPVLVAHVLEPVLPAHRVDVLGRDARRARTSWAAPSRAWSRTPRHAPSAARRAGRRCAGGRDCIPRAGSRWCSACHRPRACARAPSRGRGACRRSGGCRRPRGPSAPRPSPPTSASTQPAPPPEAMPKALKPAPTNMLAHLGRRAEDEVAVGREALRAR